MDREEYLYCDRIAQKAVNYCLKRFPSRQGDREDWYQLAWIGIMKAHALYDPAKGNKSAFFSTWAKGELRNNLRKRYYKDRLQVADKPLEEFTITSDRKDSLKEGLEKYSDEEIMQSLTNFKNGELDEINKSLVEEKLATSPPILLVDYSVLVHLIYHPIRAILYNIPKNIIKIVKQTFKNYYKDLVNKFPRYQIVLGLDIKRDGCYWRHDLFQDYKGIRQEKEELFYSFYNWGLEVAIEEGYEIYGYPSLEFDDIASIFCYFNRKYKNRIIVIFTIDSDILQLVRDVDGISMYSPRVSKKMPQHRKEHDVLDYIENEYSQQVKHPKELAKIKQKFGDRSDNLPPDCLYELVDLYDIHIPFEEGLRDFIIQLINRFFK